MTNDEGTNTGSEQETLQAALDALREHEDDAGDGRWFEDLVRQVGPLILEWELAEVWRWADWPEREASLGAGSRTADDSIDLVGRRTDGKLVAIQCKARRHRDGKPGVVTGDDVDKFIAATEWSGWSERWIASNADLSPHAKQKLGPLAQDGRRKHVLVTGAIAGELERLRKPAEDPRTIEQETAVKVIVAGLDAVRATAEKRHENWNPGESRGTVVMPCGTGKTRVGYDAAARIAPEGLVVVLCPSIGLVRQIRLSYLDRAEATGDDLTTLSVCSDRTVTSPTQLRAREDERAGHDEGKRISTGEDIWDQSLLDKPEVLGDVRSTIKGIEVWLMRGRKKGRREVVFCTYQSGHKLAEALTRTRRKADVLICDEAHRTSSVRTVKSKRRAEAIRKFTLCHDADAFPATNRIYMTATPRKFEVDEGKRRPDLAVASMDDESIFGPVLYRLSYREAVTRGFLTDYRIIALAPGPKAHELADNTARETFARVEGGEPAGNGTASARFSSSFALRKIGFGMALAGGLRDSETGEIVRIGSSIAFCNRTAHSKDVRDELNDERLQAKIAELLEIEPETAGFNIEHRDAGSSAAERDEALERLRSARGEAPYAVTNVGVFGEGIDTPNLNAVAFLEPKKSGTDTIQAVGRVMRLSPEKDIGYVIVPLVIPPGAHAEAWLESRKDQNGWKELGQVLQALQRHDGRIEEDLSKMLRVVVPAEDEEGEHLLAVRSDEGVSTWLWRGPRGKVKGLAAEHRFGMIDALADRGGLRRTDDVETLPGPACATYGIDTGKRRKTRVFALAPGWVSEEGAYPVAGPAQEAHDELLARLKKDDRERRRKRRKGTGQGQTGEDQNDGKNKKKPPLPTDLFRELELAGVDAEALEVNLLEQSGLLPGRERDFNILQETVERSAALLKADELETELEAELGMEHRSEKSRNEAADPCTVAALMLTTAAIMQARLERGGALAGKQYAKLDEVARSGEAAELLHRTWNTILETDYQPVFGIARDILMRVTRQTRRTAGLDAAVRGIARDAGEIAERYADMGMDHAGELFNKVMGNQASDGAYFTIPTCAVMLAELGVEALDETDWANPATWRKERSGVFDPTCGSGTLLVAWGEAVKRRARAGRSRSCRDRKAPPKAGRRDADGAGHQRRVPATRRIATDVGRRTGAVQAHEPVGDAVRMATARKRRGRAGEGRVAGAAGGQADRGCRDEVSQERTDDSSKRQGTYQGRDADRGDGLAVSGKTNPDGAAGTGPRTSKSSRGASAAIMNPPFVTRDKLGETTRAGAAAAVRGGSTGCRESWKSGARN